LRLCIFFSLFVSLSVFFCHETSETAEAADCGAIDLPSSLAVDASLERGVCNPDEMQKIELL
jgi:hypothetical protein